MLTLLAAVALGARAANGASPLPLPAPPPPGASDVAVCISGHARSFVQRRVFESLKANVLDALGGRGADGAAAALAPPADAFLYLELEEAAEAEAATSARLGKGWDSGPSACSASAEGLAPALAALRPVIVRFHDTRNVGPQSPGGGGGSGDGGQQPGSSGFAPGGATAELASGLGAPTACAYPSDRARPQLEKLALCFALVREHEAARGYDYAWVARSRPDLGWLWPLPPAAHFDARFLYVPSTYWPMGDQVRYLLLSPLPASAAGA